MPATRADEGEGGAPPRRPACTACLSSVGQRFYFALSCQYCRISRAPAASGPSWAPSMERGALASGPHGVADDERRQRRDGDGH